MTTDLTFDALVPVYLDACRAEGKSPKTVVAYAESLAIYMRVARREHLPLHVDRVTTTDVYRYLAAIRGSGVCDATQHRRHREVKHFYSWLKRMEIVESNPFQKVPLIRLEQRVVRPITPEEIGKMLAVLDVTTLVGARNRALTLFLLDTGVRASEATGLDLEQVDLGGGRARILNGKGRKQRVVAFGAAVRTATEDYLAFRGVGGPGRCFRPPGEGV